MQAHFAQDATRIGGYAYQIIDQQSQRLIKARSHVLADTDPENLHKMRIATRRLSAALHLFTDVVSSEVANTPTHKKDKNKTSDFGGPKQIKALTKLTKSLGKVRDIDVMQAWFGQALNPTRPADSQQSRKSEKAKESDNIATNYSFSKKEKKVVQTLLKKLKKQRKKEFARLEETLSNDNYKKLTKQLKQWSKQPAFQPAAQQAATHSAIDRIVLPLTELLQHPGWRMATHKRGNQHTVIKSITLPQLNQTLSENGDLLHDLRKQIKRTRYQTEFFRGLYGIAYAAQVREFRTLQKVLGQLQDQLVITDFLTQELGPNWAEKLPSIHTAFQTSRLALWQQWQPLQQKYLKLASTLPQKKIAA